MIDVFSSPAGTSPVVIEAVFPASPTRLFQAWTRPEDLRKWFGEDPATLGQIEIDLYEGGAWRFHMRSDAQKTEVLEGQYLKIREGELLSFSWRHSVQTADGTLRQTSPSAVTITFEPMGKATRMRLEHRAILTEGGRQGVRAGWIASFEALLCLIGPTCRS